MKTKIETLKAGIKANRGNIRKSLEKIINGYTVIRTGYSGYAKGWARKQVWTMVLSGELQRLKIKHAIGNDAPRGGASGEYVRITDKVLLKQVAAHVAAIKAAAEIEIERAKNALKEKATIVLSEIESLNIRERMFAERNSQTLKDASGLSWSQYRSSVKEKYAEEWAKFKGEKK